MSLRHIGFIMDGNGRWATAKHLPRSEGYSEGLKALKRVAAECAKRGVEVVSVYAFSTENIARPEEEKSAIFKVVKAFNAEYYGSFKIRYMGNIDDLPDDIVASVTQIEERTSDNEGMTLNIALNYGARADMLNACKRAFDNGDFTDDAIEKRLSSAGLLPLDLIVRTGGEKRLSNFMLFEAAYSELIFLDKLWPDMTEQDVDDIFEEFNKRTRKFGR